jgi:hypothetical protein
VVKKEIGKFYLTTSRSYSPLQRRVGRSLLVFHPCSTRLLLTHLSLTHLSLLLVSISLISLSIYLSNYLSIFLSLSLSLSLLDHRPPWSHSSHKFGREPTNDSDGRIYLSTQNFITIKIIVKNLSPSLVFLPQLLSK